jgi:hypothetical protein
VQDSFHQFATHLAQATCLAPNQADKEQLAHAIMQDLKRVAQESAIFYYPSEFKFFRLNTTGEEASTPSKSRSNHSNKPPHP